MVVVWIFKTKRHSRCDGVTQVFLLVSMLIFAVSLLIMTNLVQKNQENRSRAAGSEGSESAYLVFRFVLSGVKPAYIDENEGEYNCFDSLGKLNVDVINRTNGKTQINLEIDYSPVEGEVNSNGDQIFETDEVVLDTKFNSLDTNNFLKIRGLGGLMRVMCHDGQTKLPMDESACNLSLSEDSVIDFTEYPLIRGDINADGLVNGIDYGILKKNFNAGAGLVCGNNGDLNADGVVNWVDGNLLKNSLSMVDDKVNLIVPNISLEPGDLITVTPLISTLTLEPVLVPTGEMTPTLVLTPTSVADNMGIIYSSNSSSCKLKDGICATFSKSLSTGAVCGVDGYGLVGTVITGLCPGNTKVVCCTGVGVPVDVVLTPTVIPSSTPIPTSIQSITTVLDPIIPESVTYSVVTETLKFWINKKSGYYVTRIWAKEPYKQLRKYSAYDEGKKYDQINNLVDNALKNAGIKNKAILAINNDVYVGYESYHSNSDYWKEYAGTGLIINNGVVYRNDSNSPSRRMLVAGIGNRNNLGLIEESKNPVNNNTSTIINQRKINYDLAIASGIQNTISNFGYCIKNGEIDDRVKTLTGSAERQIICQVNSNNFIQITTTSGFTIKEVSNIAKSLGCKIALEMDGGGSTALYYKKPLDSNWTGKLNVTTRGKMWSILYWTEL